MDTPSRPLRGGGRTKHAKEQVTMDYKLMTMGLQAVNNYCYTVRDCYTVGDCFFDSVEYLTGFPSLALRNAAVDALHSALSTSDEIALNNTLEIIRSRTTHGRRLTYTAYCMGMRKSAIDGGLWADVPAGFWTAIAANLTINVYRIHNGAPCKAETWKPTGPIT